MRGKLTYSNVMSTIAVFLALAGGSFAVAAALENNSVKSKHVKDNQLKSEDLKDGEAVGEEDLVPDEEFHVVGTAGEPAFGIGGDNDCVWTDLSQFATSLEPLGFYKDRGGRVHLNGSARSDDGSGGDDLCDAGNLVEAYDDGRIFTLPPGYRPEGITLLSALSKAPKTQVIIGGVVDAEFIGVSVPAGAVIAVGEPVDELTSGVTMGEVSFRAAGD